ncbi:MAG: hypothetical protein KJP19_10970 [Deltaproteobacteria bacterium]|nr:hypothetical protein [Deltaproteobacteria bacterium]
MNSPTIKELHKAIRQVRRRRKLILHVRQIGWSLAILTALFVFFGILEMTLHPPSLVSMLLFSLLGVVVGVLCWWYAWAVRRFDSDDRRLAHYIDERTPGLQQRLITSMDSWEKQSTDSPSQLVESLWLDTVAHVHSRNVQQVTNSRSAWFAAGTAFLLICILAGALWDSTRFSGAARRVAWPWSIPAMNLQQPEGFKINPGDILVRRGSDIAITARLENVASKKVFLYLQEKTEQWKRVPMQVDESTADYLYYLPGVANDISYYVDSGEGRSKQYQIKVFDLTRVETIDVDYIFPEYTGIENKTEKNGGDIIAPEGTKVKLHISFNGPIQQSVLKFEDGTTIDLSHSNNVATGAFTVAKDTTYIVDAFDQEGRHIENPMEYLVRSTPDLPPEISVDMPGRDLKVMALEEVSIAVTARDDYGMTKLALNYNIAGDFEENVTFLNVEGKDAPRSIDGRMIVYLEDLRVVPGDFIAYFLTAEDNNGIIGPSEVLSDIYFLEVISTDEEFRRASQQGGGGGQFGQQQQPSALLENQKNIIAATWKLLSRQKKFPGETFTEDVKIVAESQRNIAQRTQMSLSRLNERFSFADESYDLAVTLLREAVGHMQTAAEKLSSEQLKEALGPEQAALQAILKADAQNRRTAIQMASQRGGSGAGGASFNEREDLRELFEMEMGRLENRYEMPGTASGSGNAEQEDVLKRLRQLAQRQERLNRAQSDADRRQNRLTEAQQRRHLEELRREQEALSREAESLARKWSQQAGVNRTQSSLSSLDQAISQMQEAARNLERRDPGIAAASGRQALQKLRDQEKRIARRQGISGLDLVKQLSEKAAQLQAQESEIINNIEGLRVAESRKIDREYQPSTPDTQKGIEKIISKKELLQGALQETEDIIRAARVTGRQSQPELELKALEALRSLKTEDLEQRIEASKSGLLARKLEVAMDMERKIEQSIRRLSAQLHEFDELVPKSGAEKNQQAAADAAALSRELENLQRQVEALRVKQEMSAQSRGTAGIQPRDSGLDQRADLSDMRDGLARSRKHAQGLLEPWAQGESWAVDARSIYRELTSTQIEDFITQPALWQRLLEPVRELASTLQAKIDMERFNNNAFSPSEQAPPPRYESQVETYYRSLSEITKKREK